MLIWWGVPLHCWPAAFLSTFAVLMNPKSRTPNCAGAAESMLAELLWDKFRLFPTDPGVRNARSLHAPLQQGL